MRSFLFFFAFPNDIYIPVWFDLNDEMAEAMQNYAQIYIPVWFDLNLERKKEKALKDKFTFQYGSI